MAKKEIILEKYSDLVEDIQASYNQIRIIDNYDFNEDKPYCIFYLNKNESLDKFEDAWLDNLEYCRGFDFGYEDIIDNFNKEYEEKFDYIELTGLDIYTNSAYELEI